MLAQLTAASLAGPAILILAACATQQPATDPTPGFCALTTERTASGTRITATVTPDRDIAGDYTLSVSAAGTGSSAQIDQGGPFEAAAGVTLMLGDVTLSDIDVIGYLVITAEGTTTTCPITRQ